MKAKYYLLAGLSAMMLGACSDNDDVVSDNQGDKPTIEGEAYMDLNLNFPGTQNGRAVNDQIFAPGEGDESKIKSLSVYYFNEQGSYRGKGTAQFTSLPGSLDNIEKKVTAQVPAEVVKDLNTNKAQIIVVINEPEGFGLSLDAGKSTFEDNFNTALETSDNAGFMMTSVNYYPEDNSSTTNPKAHKIQYFTEISKDNIYEGKGVAKNPVEVWVERVCGKVELSLAANVQHPNAATFKVIGWNLNVRNKSVYPVKVLDETFTKLTGQQWPGFDDWTNSDAVSRHRSYWAKDPNYNNEDQYSTTIPEATEQTLENHPFTLITAGELSTELTKPLYCLENTFNYDHQNKNETTTAVIKAKYTPTGLNDWQSDNKNVNTWVMDDGFAYTLKTYVSNFLASQEQNIWYLESSNPQETYATATYNQITYTDGKLGQTEGLKIYKKTNDSDNPFVEYKEEDWTALNTAFDTYKENALIYNGAECYYEIPIRHFTDEEVPLAGTAGSLENSTINDKSQLGRYGIVRNHCYQLTINSVSKPGKPIPGNQIIIPDPDPDDDKDLNISVSIKVLSWAVRTQGVDL